MKNSLLLALANLLLLPMFLYGTTITFQNGVSGYSGTEDTILFSNAPATNYGANGFLQVGALQNNGIARSLIRFDLSSLVGQYSSINSITMKLAIQGGFTNTVRLFEPLSGNAAWIEGTAANGVQADTSTWGKLSQTTIASGIDWIGGPGLGTTGYGSLLASTPFTAGQVGTLDFVISSSATATALIDDFTSGSNEGFFLVATNENISANSTVLFLSSDTGAVSDRPLLIVDFTPTPEPTVAITLILGLGVLASRRHRPDRSK
jgi:hypothetical protein